MVILTVAAAAAAAAAAVAVAIAIAHALVMQATALLLLCRYLNDLLHDPYPSPFFDPARGVGFFRGPAIVTEIWKGVVNGPVG